MPEMLSAWIDVRAGDVPRAEDAERDQRVLGRRLARDERREERGRDAAQEQRLAVAPAVLGRRLDDRVDAEHQRARDQHGAGHVRAAAEADPLVALDQAQGEHGGDDRDRHVDEEDPVPVDRLGQDPAGEQPDRAAARGDERVDPDRLRLLPRLREHRDDHPEDHGRGHRAADALDEARAHEHLLALREPAQERGDREERQAGHEDVAAARAGRRSARRAAAGPPKAIR